MARKYAGPLRGSFWAIVVVLFVLAAWQPAARMYVDWRVQRNVSAIETARRTELGVATAEFEAGRVQILQQIRDLQARGDYAAALKLGGR
ncbi:MAG: hypothetical protein ABI607_12255, partial [Betaproteobacteria bacterium]